MPVPSLGPKVAPLEMCPSMGVVYFGSCPVPILVFHSEGAAYGLLIQRGVVPFRNCPFMGVILFERWPHGGVSSIGKLFLYQWGSPQPPHMFILHGSCPLPILSPYNRRCFLFGNCPKLSSRQSFSGSFFTFEHLKIKEF